MPVAPAARLAALINARPGELRAALAGTLPIEGLASRTAAAWMVRQLVMEAGGQIVLSPAGEPTLLFGAVIPG